MFQDDAEESFEIDLLRWFGETCASYIVVGAKTDEEEVEWKQFISEELIQNKCNYLVHVSLVELPVYSFILFLTTSC